MWELLRHDELEGLEKYVLFHLDESTTRTKFNTCPLAI